MDWGWIVAFVALGVFAGFTAGLFGVGGGAVVMPVLASIFVAQGIAADKVVHLALGTSMATIVVTSLSSARAHHARGAVRWRLVAWMAPAVALGSFAATFVAGALSSVVLAVFFSGFMALVALQMWRGGLTVTGSRQPPRAELMGVGAGIGAVSAMVSIGGGTMTVPYLTWRNVDVKHAIGTSAAVGIPISVAGAIGYLAQSSIGVAHTTGFVYWPAMICVASASFLLAPLGARVAHALPVPKLKKLFAVLLIALSLKMLLSIL